MNLLNGCVISKIKVIKSTIVIANEKILYTDYRKNDYSVLYNPKAMQFNNITNM